MKVRKKYNIAFFDREVNLAEIAVWAFDKVEARKKASVLKQQLSLYNDRPHGRGAVKTIVESEK